MGVEFTVRVFPTVRQISVVGVIESASWYPVPRGERVIAQDVWSARDNALHQVSAAVRRVVGVIAVDATASRGSLQQYEALSPLIHFHATTNGRDRRFQAAIKAAIEAAVKSLNS